MGLSRFSTTCPALLRKLSPEQLQLVQPRLSPIFQSIKELYEKRFSKVFKDVLQKIPKSIAEVVDTDTATGESFIGFLLKKKDYRLVLNLLGHKPDNLDIKTVIQLLKHSRDFSKISQVGVEELLQENCQETIDLYNTYKDVTI